MFLLKMLLAGSLWIAAGESNLFAKDKNAEAPNSRKSKKSSQHLQGKGRAKHAKRNAPSAKAPKKHGKAKKGSTTESILFPDEGD